MTEMLIPVPSSVEAERSMLSCILSDNLYFERAVGWIQEGAIYNDDNEKIWKAMKRLYSDGKKMDMVTVYEEIREMYGEQNSVPYSTIIDIAETPTLAPHTEEYAKIIHKRYIQRRIREKANKMYSSSSDSYIEADKTLESVANDIRELQLMKPNKERPMKDILKDTLENIKTSSNIVEYGIPALDAPAGGMTRGELTVLGGRPGHGKTTTAINIAKSLVENNKKVLFFSREMTNIEIMKKMAIIETNISYEKLRKNELTEEEVGIVEETMKTLEEKYSGKLILFDNIRYLEESSIEIRRHPDVDVVIDDYIQLIKIEKNVDRRFQIEEIMVEYKWLAKDMKFAGLLLSQLSRGIDTRILDPRPRMSDYAEGGTIEQIAECALFSFYGYNFDNELYKPFEYEIISAKTRYGKVGTYKIGFNGDRCKLYPTVTEAEIGD